VPQVVLIAIDGVRPDEVFEGVDTVLAGEQDLPAAERVSAERLMPNLHLARAGARRRPLATIRLGNGSNFVSLASYRGAQRAVTGRRRTTAGPSRSKPGHAFPACRPARATSP
jgi:hypothetical protein